MSPTSKNDSRKNAGQKVAHLLDVIETVRRLRAPDGCPWDRAQTHQSLRPYVIEEAYEVVDALDQIHSSADLAQDSKRNPFREELGDLLMQVLLHSEMASEANAFDVYEVAEALNDKLIRRHPHVFGEVKADSVESAFQTWEKQKAKEKAAKTDASVLDGVPRGLPSLQRAARVLEKVTKVGFQWSDMQGPLAKVDEELNEFKAEVLALDRAEKEDHGKREELRKKLEHELGDLLFTLCNVAYLMKISPEDALRTTLKRFENRFRYVEKGLKNEGKLPEQATLAEMDRYWDEAKEKEKKGEAL